MNAPAWVHLETGDVTVRDGERVLTVIVRVRRWHPSFWLYLLRVWRLGRASSP